MLRIKKCKKSSFSGFTRCLLATILFWLCNFKLCVTTVAKQMNCMRGLPVDGHDTPFTESIKYQFRNKDTVWFLHFTYCQMSKRSKLNLRDLECLWRTRLVHFLPSSTSMLRYGGAQASTIGNRYTNMFCTWMSIEMPSALSWPVGYATLRESAQAVHTTSLLEETQYTLVRLPVQPGWTTGTASCYQKWKNQSGRTGRKLFLGGHDMWVVLFTPVVKFFQIGEASDTKRQLVYCLCKKSIIERWGRC